MIAVQLGMNGPYQLFYQHCDTYPSWLGLRIAEKLRDGVEVAEMAEEFSWKDVKGLVQRPEDAFMKIQGDLDWIYVIHNIHDENTLSLGILRTSNPWCDWKKPFVWRVWSSYVRFFPEDLAQTMRLVEMTAGITLHGLNAFYKAYLEEKPVQVVLTP